MYRIGSRKGKSRSELSRPYPYLSHAGRFKWYVVLLLFARCFEKRPMDDPRCRMSCWFHQQPRRRPESSAATSRIFRCF